jgi:hypothetical protein
MRESEYVANIELARGAVGVRPMPTVQRRYAQTYKPEKKENRALSVALVLACSGLIGALLALGV